jgi:mannose-6-phosphate isomerase-like protein (cupin superfamily)
MSAKPVIVHEDERQWEGWGEEQVAERGNVLWKTLISAGLTPTTALTVGVARVPSGGELAAHRHEQPEVYLVFDGAGVVTIDGLPSDYARARAFSSPEGRSIPCVRLDRPISGSRTLSLRMPSRT